MSDNKKRSASSIVLNFVDSHKSGLSPLSLKAYKRYWLSFSDFLVSENSIDLNVLTTGDINEFLTETTDSTHTRNQATAAIRYLLDELDELPDVEILNIGKIFRKLKYVKVDKAKKLWLPMNKINEAIENVSVLYVSRAAIYRNTALLKLLKKTLLRCSELSAIQMRDIHPDALTIDIRGKGGRYQKSGLRAITCTMQISKAVLVDIERYVTGWRFPTKDEDGKARLGSGLIPLFTSQQGRKMSDKAIYNVCSKSISSVLKEERGNHGPHCFRRSVARHLLFSKKMNIVEVKNLLRHSRIDTTMIYVDIGLDDLKVTESMHRR